jgi:hypothetical protein
VPSSKEYRDAHQRQQDAIDAYEANRSIGTALHARFNRSFTEGTLITPERSATALIAYLGGDDSGSIWDVSDASARV